MPSNEPRPRSPDHSRREQYFSKISSESKPNEDHLDKNEDAILIDQEKGAAGIFGGLPAFANADHASALAAEEVGKVLGGAREGMTLDEEARLVGLALESANTKIFEANQTPEAKADPAKRMATTASVVKLWKDPSGRMRAIIGHAGNARAYIFRADGSLTHVTRDHIRPLDSLSREQAFELQKKLAAAENLSEDLSPEEQMAFGSRDIVTGSLGQRRQAAIDVVTTTLGVGEKIVLVTDGVHHNLTDVEIAAAIAASPAQEAGRRIVEAAAAKSKTGSPRATKDAMSAAVLSPTEAAASTPEPTLEHAAEKVIEKLSDLTGVEKGELRTMLESSVSAALKKTHVDLPGAIEYNTKEFFGVFIDNLIDALPHSGKFKAIKAVKELQPDEYKKLKNEFVSKLPDVADAKKVEKFLEALEGIGEAQEAVKQYQSLLKEYEKMTPEERKKRRAEIQKAYEKSQGKLFRPEVWAALGIIGMIILMGLVFLLIVIMEGVDRIHKAAGKGRR